MSGGIGGPVAAIGQGMKTAGGLASMAGVPMAGIPLAVVGTAASSMGSGRGLTGTVKDLTKQGVSMSIPQSGNIVDFIKKFGTTATGPMTGMSSMGSPYTIPGREGGS